MQCSVRYGFSSTGTRTPIRDLDKRRVEIEDQALEMGTSHRLSLVHPNVTLDGVRSSVGDPGDAARSPSLHRCSPIVCFDIGRTSPLFAIRLFDVGRTFAVVRHHPRVQRDDHARGTRHITRVRGGNSTIEIARVTVRTKGTTTRGGATHRPVSSVGPSTGDDAARQEAPIGAVTGTVCPSRCFHFVWPRF